MGGSQSSQPRLDSPWPGVNPAPAENGDAVDAIISRWHEVRPYIDVSPLEVFGRLHRTFLLYRGEINAVFAEMGTSEPGFDVLAALRRAEPSYTLTAGELAEQTLVTTGGLSLRLRKLEDDGLVFRHRDAQDQRVIHVGLTASGLKLIEYATRRHYGNLARLKAGLSASETDQLAHLLGRLFESMSSAEQIQPSLADDSPALKEPTKAES